MSKITIVTDRRGKFIGAVQGHELSQKVGDVQAHVSFEPGHKLHKVDADIDLVGMHDPKELEKELTRSIPKRARPTKPKGPRQKR